MARISYVEKDQATGPVREIYERVEKGLGRILNIYKTIGHSPEFIQTLQSGFDGLTKTKVDARLRELAYLTTSVTNNCEY